MKRKKTKPPVQEPAIPWAVVKPEYQAFCTVCNQPTIVMRRRILRGFFPACARCGSLRLVPIGFENDPNPDQGTPEAPKINGAGE